MSSTTLPVCPKTGSTSPSLTVHLCLHTAPGNRECAREDCRAPQSDAEFVASMEQVLDLYQKPYDPDCPVVCMDEQPVQLVKETRAPMAATKNRPRRVDYEYERAGTASIFLFSEPLAGWRQATARARRTKVDWALEVAGLLEGRYADCEKITLVCDNLNTHTKGAFYKVFEPTRARQLVRRIEFCYTPKHGSWLNIAENELSSLTRQCVRGRRIGDLGTLHGEGAHSRFPGHALTPTGVMAIRCKQFHLPDL